MKMDIVFPECCGTAAESSCCGGSTDSGFPLSQTSVDHEDARFFSWLSLSLHDGTDPFCPVLFLFSLYYISLSLSIILSLSLSV